MVSCIAAGGRGGARSDEDFGKDFAGDVGEAEMASVVEVGEALVIDAEQVEEGGMEVVDAGAVADGFVADFIRFAMGCSAFDASPGHPGEEPVGIMVASAVALRDGHSPEFPAPDDEGAVP